MSPEDRIAHLGIRQSRPIAIVRPLDERNPPPVGKPAEGPRTADLKWFTPVDLADKPIPARRWLVPDLIPDPQVTLLGGDGGTGKSLIAQQLAVATAVGAEWIGQLPEKGPVVFASAEDDKDELHRRLSAIAASHGVKLANIPDLHFTSLAGQDAVMGAPDNLGIIRGTPLWGRLKEKIEAVKPRLVAFDPLADLFAGNENNRGEARQFIGQLRGLAIEHACAVLLLNHPSLSGIASGAGTSGSTGWANSVRSRLYLERLKDEDGVEVDPSLRVLRVMKANYGPIGAEVRLRWSDGVFRLNGQSGGTLDRIAAEAKAERVFLDLLKQFEEQGRSVSPKVSNAYAPSVFAKHPEAGGLNKKVFTAAMERLFKAKRITVEVTGPESRRSSKIVFVSNEEHT